MLQWTAPHLGRHYQYKLAWVGLFGKKKEDMLLEMGAEEGICGEEYDQNSLGKIFKELIKAYYKENIPFQ